MRDAAVLQPEDPLDVQRTQRVIPSPKALQVNFFLIVASRRSGRSPYHAPAEVGRVLVYYSEAALHKLALEARVSPIAQLRVDGVAAKQRVTNYSRYRGCNECRAGGRGSGKKRRHLRCKLNEQLCNVLA